MTSSTALLTDRYELTMLDAARLDGSIDRPCVFELFTRSLPAGRRFAVAAGLGRALDALGDFRFDDDVLAALADDEVVSEPTLAWLAGYRFRGEVWGLREGELVSPDVPVLTVRAGFGDAVALETLLLSILNHDSAVASAAARMVAAADGRTLLEFGGRRTHETAAVAAARAAHLVGFTATSNLEAGRRYGIPTAGTSAHAFTLLHDDELAAFRGQVAALGPGTTLLVDTYDTRQGIRNAVAAAGPELGAIRIDSGDLVAEAHHARALLDELGATRTRIVLSGDLDEHRIAALRGAPVDAFGVGTSVVTGAGAPTAGFVYKLVARATTPDGPLRPVAKAGGDKATVGGWKATARLRTGDGRLADVLHPWGTAPPAGARPLQVPLVRHGEVLDRPDLAGVREHHRSVLAELPEDAFHLDDGPPTITTRHLDATGAST
ncbi:nicotinate phosphoribosyltransferase [Nitriliruptoraceae bacterium ZYF776]|nr:nicotinate phosphoribosyltransferase [Profundirhabdus halotolerans]